MRATIEWNVRAKRSKLKREEVADEGTVLDLSLEGALIETPLDAKHKTGDVVPVRLGGADGEATIRHVRLSDDRETWLYGIRWVPSPELREAVENGVEQLRDQAGELRRSWEDQRR